MNWWPFKRKPAQIVEERELTWIEILDDFATDPTAFAHEQRMDWIYMNMSREDYEYTSWEDDFYPGRLRCYGFHDKSNALLFKLTWGGSV